MGEPPFPRSRSGFSERRHRAQPRVGGVPRLVRRESDQPSPGYCGVDVGVRSSSHTRRLTPTTYCYVQVVAPRKRKAIPLDVVVPTAVRVEAGWDRRAPAASLINHLRIADAPLDTASANVAADLAARLHMSVVDAHLGAAVRAVADYGRVVIITSEPDDIAAATDPVPATVVTI